MSDDVTENVTTPNAIVEGKYAYMLKRPCTCGHTQAEHVKIDGTAEVAGSCYHCGADGCLEFKSIHAYNSYPPTTIDPPQRPAPPPPVYCTGCPGTIDMSKQFVVNLAQGKAICLSCGTPVRLPPSASVFWLPYNLPGMNTTATSYKKLQEEFIVAADTNRRAGSDRRTTHYGSADDPYEAVKVIEAWSLNFSLGNAVKYIRRAGHKATSTAVEDLEKAQAYVEFELARLKRENKP